MRQASQRWHVVEWQSESVIHPKTFPSTKFKWNRIIPNDSLKKDFKLKWDRQFPCIDIRPSSTNCCSETSEPFRIQWNCIWNPLTGFPFPNHILSDILSYIPSDIPSDSFSKSVNSTMFLEIQNFSERGPCHSGQEFPGQLTSRLRSACSVVEKFWNLFSPFHGLQSAFLARLSENTCWICVSGNLFRSRLSLC